MSWSSAVQTRWRRLALALALSAAACGGSGDGGDTEPTDDDPASTNRVEVNGEAYPVQVARITSYGDSCRYVKLGDDVVLFTLCHPGQGEIPLGSWTLGGDGGLSRVDVLRNRPPPNVYSPNDSTATSTLVVTGTEGSTLTIDASMVLTRVIGEPATDTIVVHYSGPYDYSELDPDW